MHNTNAFSTSSPQWGDCTVRKEAALYALSAMTEHKAVASWILDDTGFLKQGRHSVGVQRQYTGSAGKVTNCQVGVSLTIATATQHVPIDFELYLPRDWTNDAARRAEARIPDDVTFMTKPELGLKMIERALQDDIPPRRVLVVAAYGPRPSSAELCADTASRTASPLTARRRSGSSIRLTAVAAPRP
jgi:SRSO17 transposase